jgi:Mrp family chromosome partitioning ATPase
VWLVVVGCGRVVGVVLAVARGASLSPDPPRLVFDWQLPLTQTAAFAQLDIRPLVASVLNQRAVTKAAKITAADPLRFDAALVQALTDIQVARLQHDTAIAVARIQATATIEASRLAHGGHLPPSTT